MIPNQMDDSETLNIAAWQEHSSVNGPGIRYVLWLQGCFNMCKGCINPEFAFFIERNLISTQTVADSILRTNGIKGVTFTGGEPMMQAKQLCKLAQIVGKTGLSILCYTGFTYRQLLINEDPWVSELLHHTDILIDGPFIEELSENLLWRGSSNQRIIHLSDRYGKIKWDDAKNITQTEFTIGENGYEASGSWPSGLMEKLQKNLRRI